MKVDLRFPQTAVAAVCYIFSVTIKIFKPSEINGIKYFIGIVSSLYMKGSEVKWANPKSNTGNHHRNH